MTAAVLGSSFRLEDASEMLGKTPAVLVPMVEEAMGAGILKVADNEFCFRHGLLCAAFGQVIPTPARTALHRQYGHLLLNRGDTPALAAAHLLKAAHSGDAALLADLDAAGAQALRSAPQTAADLALRALELTPPADPHALSRAVAATEALTAAGRLNQAAELAAETMAKPLPPVVEARLRSALSSVLCARGQAKDAADQAKIVLAQARLPYKVREKALTAYLQALRVSRSDEIAGPLADVILARANEHESHTIVAALAARAVLAWETGQIHKAMALLRAAARHCHGISPDARDPQPLLALAAALVDLGQVQEADGILRAADDPALRGLPAEATLLILRARLRVAKGCLAAAYAEAQAAMTSAETLGLGGYASTARCVLALIALRRGDLRAATQHIRLSDPEPAPYGPQELARNALAKALIDEARNGPAAAIRDLRQASTAGSVDKRLVLCDFGMAPWLVRTCLAAGDQDLAAHVSASAVRFAEANPGFPGLAAAAAHSQGLARHDSSLLAQALGGYSDPWAKASAGEDLAVLLVPTAKDQAISYLKSALEGYQQIGAERDQARVRQRLRQLGIRPRHWTTVAARPVTGWDSLTHTEQAIARLVAEGLNNQEVASRIYISTHTVVHHLRQAFRKLHIASRVELARIVVEQMTPGQELNADRVSDLSPTRRFL